jgi:protein involved in polysaccharide export with SLBB domain
MIFRYVLLAGFLLIIGIAGSAQVTDVMNQDLSQIKIEELTDDQILQIRQRAEESGLTESQMKALMISRGFPPNEINKLEQRLKQIDSGLSTEQIKDRSRQQDTTLTPEAMEPIIEFEPGPESRIFGYDLFRNRNLTFEPSLNIPTPHDYQVGPGDQLIIDIWGASQQNYQLQVTPEGNIHIEDLGPIQVSGLTMDQASDRIISRLKTMYAGLSGPNRNTYAQITLGNTRSINVHLLGEVNVPGTYTLSSFATVFNALYASGGPTINGSFRNVELIRNNAVVAVLDIYDFLMYGKQDNNIRLEDQDVIKVNPYVSRVDLTGEVKRPGLYELTRDENMDDALLYSGGFSDKAYQKTLTVYRNTDTEREILNVNKEDFGTFSMQDGDSIPVAPILKRFENRITINGAVYRPGEYSLSDGLTLNELISRAEGLREDAFLNRALIYRTREDLSLEIIPVNLRAIINNETSFTLVKEDVVSVASIFDLREDYFVEINGEINHEGIFPYMENTSLEDIIVMAGGLKESASLAKVEVARRIKSGDVESISGKISEIFYFNIDKELHISPDASIFTLQPFDQVFIRKSPGYEEARSLRVEGEVLYPGTYVLSSKSERISDLIGRAGGFTQEAYLEGAQLIRKVEINQERRQEIIENLMSESSDSLQFNIEESNEQAIGIDLTQIMRNPGSEFDLLLQENDRLIIPKELQTVRLSGALLFPITVRYDKNYNFNKYIAMSGGFADNAKRNKTYVIYANGSVDKTKRFIFIKNYPDVAPGAEIVVPQKQPKERMTTGEIIGITSALSSMALVIVTIINSLHP